MKIKHFSLIVAFLVLLASCKSDFEKIRTSGDVDQIYQRALNYYEEGEYLKAQTLFELVIGSFRGKPELEGLYMKYAYTFYQLERYILAAYYFKNFSNTFPNSEFREEADYMSAYSNYQLSPSFRLDQTNTNKAVEEFQLFVNTYPESERVSEANALIDQMRRKLETKAFDEGRLYYDLRQYQAAMQSLDNLLKDFPETTDAEEVRYLIIRSNFLLAENSVVDKQQERYRETIKRAERFLTRYDQSSFYNEVNTILKKSQRKIGGLATS